MAEDNYPRERELITYIMDVVIEHCAGKIADYVRELIEEKNTEAWRHIENVPLTMRQVADMFKLKPVTIYKWKERYDLPFYRSGGRWYINFKDIYQFIVEHGKLNVTDC